MLNKTFYKQINKGNIFFCKVLGVKDQHLPAVTHFLLIFDFTTTRAILADIIRSYPCIICRRKIKKHRGRSVSKTA